MCLFTDPEDLCNHAECRLIQTVRELNQDVFQRAHTANNRVMIPSLSSIMSEKPLSRGVEQFSRSASNRLIEQSQQMQNPENSETSSQLLIKLKDDVAELTRMVGLIVRTLEVHDIHLMESE